ncbi:hypothetical protein DyAD56_08960 [Dyella sp. AD56]|nr:hypothetical protein DyAD56_08960 [Dyella sp. AD56]
MRWAWHTLKGRGWRSPQNASVLLPRPFGVRVGVRGGCSPRGFIFSRHPGAGRDPVAVSLGCRVLATWPLTQRAFRSSADDAKLVPWDARVTFLCWPTHAQERVRTAKPARRAEGRMPGVKKSNPKKWPDRLTPAACRWDKPERVRNVVAWPPSPLRRGYVGALRNAPWRRGLKAGFATLPDRRG